MLPRHYGQMLPLSHHTHTWISRGNPACRTARIETIYGQGLNPTLRQSSEVLYIVPLVMTYSTFLSV